MPLGKEVGLGPCHIVLDGDPVETQRKLPAPPPEKRGTAPTIFGPCLLWPNGWMDDDATWYGGRPRPRPHCARWRPSSPPEKGAQPPIFGLCLLWPNGWMDQDTTWYGGRPRPMPYCARWGPSSPPQKGAQPLQISTHVCCGQTAV